MPSFIIVGYVRQILERGELFAPPPLPSPRAATKRPILNRVNIKIEKYLVFSFMMVSLPGFFKKEIFRGVFRPC